MKANNVNERGYFIRIGILMAVLGVGFLCYMGNCLYYASQKLFEGSYMELVDTPDPVDEDIS